MISSYDTNVTHHFKTLLNIGFQRCSTIEWECQNTKKALGKTLAVGVSELVLCATIEWE
jgi:hypothetical protein